MEQASCAGSAPHEPPPSGLACRWASSEVCSITSGRTHLGLSPRPHSDGLLVGTTNLAPSPPDVTVLLPSLLLGSPPQNALFSLPLDRRQEESSMK